MIKLQNNFTTPEQSKRLMEIGVPADSADCILRHYNWADEDLKEENWETPAIINKGISPSEAMDMYLDDEYDMTMPCWSVGRLIEIYATCTDCGLFELPLEDSLIETLIDGIEWNRLDFSKLED